MKIKTFLILILFCCLACTNDRVEYTENMQTKPESEMVFDKTKWQQKEGKDYPFREKMLNDLLYNDTIRALNKTQILTLLGEPSWERKNKNFLYYMITQKRIFSWPMHTRTLVIKLRENDTIEWIKVHE